MVRWTSELMSPRRAAAVFGSGALAVAVILPACQRASAQQIIEACPNRPGFQTGGVGAQNLLVGGGEPGYTWTVTPGYTLPPGIALDNLTGVIHGTSPTSIPGPGKVLNIPITVTDATGTSISSKPGSIVLEVQRPATGQPCGLPIFQVNAGVIPLSAVVNETYGVTLSVSGGVPPYKNWQWSGGQQLPSGLVIDSTTGVLHGVPGQGSAGQSFTFSISVQDSTNAFATVQNDYTLFVSNIDSGPIALQVPPGTVAFPVAHDLNADGFSDILWHDNAGDVATWLMNGATVSASSGVGGAPSAWSIVGQRDFNGDGTADLLWHDTSGNVAIWFMNGAHVSSSSGVGNANPGAWSIAGTGDFNGDGKGDILWHDSSGNVALWLMNGASVAQSCGVGNANASVWSIAGTGDFNSDGHTDILWHDTSGNVAIWFMNGCSVTQSSGVGNANASVWSIAGTGDFNGDGRSDILWHDSSGNVAIWFMNGASILQSSGVGNANPSAWSIAQTGDLNGDGMSDILWRDTSGNIAVWEMNSATVLQSAGIGNASAGVWTIQSLNAD